MRLVGKKLYRVGPLKCFKAGGGGTDGVWNNKQSGPNLQLIKIKKLEDEKKAREAAAAKKKREELAAEKKGMKEAFLTKQEGRGPQEAMRKQQLGSLGAMAQARKDIQSGAAARRGAEAGLRAQMAGAGARPGGAAGKRALGRAAEAGVMGAGAQAAGSAAQAAQMAGQELRGQGSIRGADIGLGRGDQRAAASYYTKLMGQRLAREGMKSQIEAAKAGQSRCFGGETKVSTPSGQVYIKDIKVGDEVLSFDDEGQISVNVVSKVHEHEPGDIYKLSYWGGEVLITPNHWLLEAGNTFLQADMLHTDHCLVDEEGNFRPVKSFEFYEKDKTYNLTVEKDHTYIANGIRVHNGGGGKAKGGAIYKKYNKGGEYPRKQGKVEGPGTEESDSIKAKLSDGEFVVNSATVRGLGKAMGAESKKDSREKGSSFLYKLQAKYGKKEDVGRNLALGGMEAGGAMFTGAEMGKLASDIAATGALGKGMKTVGSAASAGFKASEDIAAKEKAAAKAAKAEERAEDDDFLREEKMKEMIKKEGGPEAKGLRETRSIMSDKPGAQAQALGVASKGYKRKEEAKPDKRASNQYSGGGTIHHPVKAQTEDVLKKKKAKGGVIEYNKGGGSSLFAQGARLKQKMEEGAKSDKGIIRGVGEAIQKFKSGPSSDETMERIQKEVAEEHNKGGWIQGAVKKPGALRAIAKKDKLIKGDEKLSASDLNKLAAKAKKNDDSLLSKRVNLAKTFAKMRKAKGGEIKVGKGVKAKRKYREAIGWEADKIFDKKAEKDYKEGHTGYKNYKGEKSVAPKEMFLGGLMKSPLGKALVVGGLTAATGGLGAAVAGKAAAAGAMGAAKTAAASGAVAGAQQHASNVAQEEQRQQQNKQMVAQAGMKAAGEQAGKGMSMVKDESMSGGFEKGGKVKKDHPHKKYLEDLDKFLASQFPKGKKVEVDAEKKAFKAIGAKKGSIEPVKLRKGIATKDLSNKALDKKLLKELNNPNSKLRKKFEKLKKQKEKSDSKMEKSRKRGFNELAGLELEKKGKLLELMDNLTKARAADDKAMEMREAKEKFNVRERPESMDVAEEKLKEKEKEFRSPEYQKMLKLEKKGKQLEKDEKLKKISDNLRKAKEKEQFDLEMEEAKKKIDERETPEGKSPERLLEKFKEQEKKFKDPDYKEIMEGAKKEKELEKMFKQEASKKIHSGKLVDVGKGKNVGVRKQTVEEADFERSVKDPKARKFLIEQGKLDFKDMTSKEKFAQRAKERAERDDVEAKDYEKKTGFFSKLGDRFKTGELFGSSKDILAAKRKLKDKEQAEREKSGEDFEAKKALQDQKIKDRKRLIEADSPDKVGVLQRLKKPKPVVAPEVKENVKQVKDVKDSVDSKTKGMSSKDKWNIGLAIGKAALQARQQQLAAKEAREASNRQMMTQARMNAASQLGATGRQLMASGPGFEMGGSVKPGKKEMMKQATGAGFKKGGKLSFKEILKKKRMRY